MTELTSAEQATVDAAEHDGKGWAMPESTGVQIIDALLAAGLIRLRGRCELAPLGFSRRAQFLVIRAGG